MAEPPARFVDNGDGTISDVLTGLMWEKKDDNNTGGIHDKDNTYTWITNDFGLGTAYTVLLPGLNAGSGFAGHTDWRIPEVNRDGGAFELDSLIDLTRFPTIFSEFDTLCTPGCSVTTCSCTVASVYWSSTTLAFNPFFAWTVKFDFGDAFFGLKGNAAHVRAVRTVP